MNRQVPTERPVGRHLGLGLFVKGGCAQLLALLPRTPAALQAHALAALARTSERLGESAAAARWWAQAVQAARHPADRQRLARQQATAGERCLSA